MVTESELVGYSLCHGYETLKLMMENSSNLVNRFNNQSKVDISQQTGLTASLANCAVDRFSKLLSSSKGWI